VCKATLIVVFMRMMVTVTLQLVTQIVVKEVLQVVSLNGNKEL